MLYPTASSKALHKFMPTLRTPARLARCFCPQCCWAPTLRILPLSFQTQPHLLGLRPHSPVSQTLLWRRLRPLSQCKFTLIFPHPSMRLIGPTQDLHWPCDSHSNLLQCSYTFTFQPSSAVVVRYTSFCPIQPSR